MSDFNDFLSQSTETAPADGGDSGFGRWYSGADDKAQANASTYAGSKIGPDTAATVLDLQGRTGTPADVVERNVQGVQEDARRSDFEAVGLSRRAPAVASWVGESPHNAALIGDDADAVAKVEEGVQDYGFMRGLLSSFYHRGIGEAAASVGRLNAGLYALYSLPYNAIAAAAGKPQAEIPKEFLNNDVTRYWEDFGRRNTPQDLDESVVAEFGEGNYKRAARILAFKTAANLPQQVTYVGAALTGNPALAAGALAYGGTVSGLQSLKEGQDSGATPLQNTTNAVLVGGIEALGENLGTFGIAEKIAAKYGQKAAQNLIVDTVKTMGWAALGEGNEEFWTQIGQDLSARLTGVDKRNISWKEFAAQSFKDAIEAGLLGGTSGGLMTAPGAMVSGYYQRQQAQSAALAKDFYTALGDSVEATKAHARLPAATREIVDRITKGSPVQDVFIPVDAIEKYSQGANVNATQLMESVGATESFKEAQATGGHVKIPLSVWAEKVVGTDHYKALANDITFDPNELTVNQVKDLQEQVKAEAEKSKDQPPAPEAAVTEEVSKQLEDAGFKKDVAEQYAQVYGQRYKARAAILGVDPMELFKRENISFSRTDVAAPGGMNQVAVPEELSRNFTPAEGLSEADRSLEAGAINYASQHMENILQHYGTTFGSDVSTDRFRDYFSHVGYTGMNTPAFHEPAAALRRVYQDRLIEKAVAEGKTGVFFMAGGSGAGKSTALSGSLSELKAGHAAHIDSNLSNYDKAKADIQKLIDRGLSPEVAYIYRDPVDAWTNGVMRRIIHGSDNRTVPMKEHLRLSEGSYNTALRLAKEFPDRVHLIDNSRGPGNSKVIPIEELAAKGYNGSEVMKEIFNETLRLYDEGQISAEVVRSALEKGATDAEKRRVEQALREVPRRQPQRDQKVAPAKEPFRAPDFRTATPSSRVIFEVAPDPNNSDLVGRWRSLPQDARQQISQDIAGAIIPKVLEVAGVDGTMRPQLGGYLDDTNPSFSISLGEDVKAAKVVEMTKLAGFVLSQDSMMTVSEHKFPGAEAVGAITIELPDGATTEDITSLYSSLREIRVGDEQPVAGHTTVGRKMTILNYSSVDTKELAKLIDEKTSKGYNIKTDQVYAWFPSKEEFDYAGDAQQAGDAAPRGSSIQGDANRLRGEATRAIEAALSRYEGGAKAQAQGVGSPTTLFQPLSTRIPTAVYEGELPKARVSGRAAEPVDAGAGERAPAGNQERAGAGVGSIDQTETPAFKKWFGDSKVVDADGKPLVVYHGTARTFESFKKSRRNYGNAFNRDGAVGFFFSGSKDAAEFFSFNNIETAKSSRKKEMTVQGANVVPAYISMQNPMAYDFKGKDKDPDLVIRLASEAKKNGFDGLILRNVRDTPTIGSDTVYVAFEPTQIKSATGNSGAFDPNNPSILYQAASEGSRGQIRFGNQTVNIDLFEKADLSTVLHETGHLWLREMAQDAATISAKGAETPAQQQFLDDVESIKKFLGTDSLENLTVEQHEQWARASEAYFMEGKAPSSALRQAFSRFRAWLISIYKTIRSLNVSVPADVRKVMDRLVATQEEIDLAEAEQNVKPLFADAKAIGMNEAQATSYAKAIAAARSAAEEELSSRLIAEVKREQSKGWIESRASVQEEIANEINQRPVYIALSILQRGALPMGEGERAPEGLQAVKLSRDAIVKTYGEEWLAKLPKPYVYSVEGGIHPEQAAEIFGFNSGEEMLQALATATPKEELIKTLVDQRMRLLHGDMLTDGTIAEAAMQAVHNDKRAELLRKELEILASESLPALKGAVRRFSRRAPTVESIRNEAQATIAMKSPRDIFPSLYQRAETKAAKEAIDAVLKGDFDAAFDAKRRELVNHELYRAASEAKEEIDSIVEYLGKFAKDSVRERIGKAGGGYLDQIDAISERYDFRKGISLAALDKRKSLLGWMQEQTKLGYDVQIPEKILNEARRQHYKDTAYEELQGVRDTVKAIEHLARLKNELLANERHRTLDEARGEIISTIQANHKTDISKYPISPTVLDKVKEFRADFVASHTKIEFLLEFLDGGNPVGAAFQNIWKPFLDAKAKKAQMMQDAMGKLREIFSVYTRSERALWYYKRTFIPEIGEHLNKAAMISVALNWGNQYNREALMEGYKWRPEQVQAILNQLDERDWKTVQAIWDYVDTYWPQVRDLEKRVNGIAPQKVQSDVVETKFGPMRGGYYPISFDARQSWRQRVLSEGEAAQDLFGGQWARAMTRHGHTVERTNTGGKPLFLDLSVLTQHVENVIHDLSYREAVIDVSKLLEDDDLRQAIQGAAGNKSIDELQTWVRAIAGDRQKGHVAWLEGLMRRARGGATTVNLGLKVTSGLAQTLGYLNTVKELGPKYAAFGMKDVFRNGANLKRTWDFISEKSAEMRYRLSNYDRDVRDTMKKLTVAGSTPGALGVIDAYTNDARESFFYFIGFMDLATSVPTWLGAYQKALDGKVDGIGKADDANAVLYADKVVRETQSAGDVMDLARIQRGNDLFKMFTMFYSQASLQFNQFAKAVGEYRLAGDAPKMVASMALLWFLPGVLEELIRGRKPDDDEEWWKWTLKNEIYYPFQTMIFMRDIVSGMERQGYEPSPAFEAYKALTQSAKAASGLAFGDKEEMTRGDIKNIVNTVGYFTALPTRQTWQTLEYFHDWMTGDEQPDNAAQGLWRTLVTGKPRN